MKPEWFIIGINSAVAIWYSTEGYQGMGKVLYWFGATILAGGLLLMKG